MNNFYLYSFTYSYLFTDALFILTPYRFLPQVPVDAPDLFVEVDRPSELKILIFS